MTLYLAKYKVSLLFLPLVTCQHIIPSPKLPLKYFGFKVNFVFLVMDNNGRCRPSLNSSNIIVVKDVLCSRLSKSLLGEAVQGTVTVCMVQLIPFCETHRRAFLFVTYGELRINHVR